MFFRKLKKLKKERIPQKLRSGRLGSSSQGLQHSLDGQDECCEIISMVIRNAKIIIRMVGLVIGMVVILIRIQDGQFLNWNNVMFEKGVKISTSLSLSIVIAKLCPSPTYPHQDRFDFFSRISPHISAHECLFVCLRLLF